MVHRHERLCSASQLWLPHLVLCIVLPECFQDLCIWSRAVGSKSSKLQNIVDHDRLECSTHGMKTSNCQTSKCRTPTYNPWDFNFKPSDSHVQPMELQLQTV